MADQLVQEGDIILLEKGHGVYTELPMHLVYENRVGVWDKMTNAEVAIGSHRKFNTDYLAGKYIVVKTNCDGGGSQLEMNGGHSHFPNGHHVWAEKIDNPLIKVHFYQSGSFTVVNPTVQIVGKAERTWAVMHGHGD
jgi:hypothetical protein